MKRWSEEGDLRTGKTHGGHRRVHLNDLLTRLFFTLGNHPDIPFATFLDEGVRGFMRLFA